MSQLKLTLDLPAEYSHPRTNTEDWPLAGGELKPEGRLKERFIYGEK